MESIGKKKAPSESELIGASYPYQKLCVKKLESQIRDLEQENRTLRAERKLWQDELLEATDTITMLCNELALAQASRDSLIKDKKALESAILETTYRYSPADHLQVSSDPVPEKKAMQGSGDTPRKRRKRTQMRRKYEIVNTPECLRALVDAKVQIAKLKEEIILERANVGSRDGTYSHEKRNLNFLWDFVSNIFTGAANQQGSP